MANDKQEKSPFDAIRALITGRHSFSNADLDVAASMLITMIPPNDRELLRDIATANGVPIWQALLAQFRRANEGGVAYSLLLDPGWIQDDAGRFEQVGCKSCGKLFTPQSTGNVFCSNECGSAADRKAFVERAAAAAKAAREQVKGEKLAPVIDDRGRGDVDDDAPEPRGFVPFGAESVAAAVRNA